MPELEPLSFEVFRTLLSGLIHVDPQSLTPEANLIVDFGLDSLRLLQVILELEKLGLEVSPAAAWGIQTVEDAYQYYQNQVHKPTKG
jgi:acyl carrier protein